MDREQLRKKVIEKVADELYLEHHYVEKILEQLEKENGDLIYGHDTISELVARILDTLDREKENW
jgi:stalled ribosome rescue protein Dom34